MRTGLVLTGIAIAAGAAGFAISTPAHRGEAGQVGTAPAAELSPGSSCALESTIELSRDVRETSGLALSGDGGAVWTHNDAGAGAILYRVDGRTGALSEVRIEGAGSVDWEDIAAGECAGGRCLFIGDIGDNNAERHLVVIYRLNEPGPGASSVRAEAMPARYPDGARDAEALLVVEGTPYIVSKGREGPIELFRYPSTWRDGEYPELERVRRLMPKPRGETGQVTAASVSPDGEWVALRTYGRLEIHSTATFLSGSAPPAVTHDLLSLGEEQGEGLALGADGAVWLSSEAESGGNPTLTRLSCRLPRG